MLEVRAKFNSPEGDHIMLLNVYRMYKAAQGNKVYTLMQSPHLYTSLVRVACVKCV